MKRIRINNKSQLRNALETIILKKIERGEKEILNEIIQAENSEQLNKNDYLNFLKRLKPVAFEFWPQFKLKLNIPFVCPDPVSDWYFTRSYWTLYNKTYVSPPSCIALGGNTSLPIGAICIKPGAYPINEGRVNSWLNSSITGQAVGFYFRNQGPSNVTKTYIAMAHVDNKTAYFSLDGTKFDEFSDSGIPANNTWFRRQVKFYVSENHLIIRWEGPSNGNWVQIGRDVVDSNNKYYGEQTNYAGIYRVASLNAYAWFDDTEIWKAG